MPFAVASLLAAPPSVSSSDPPQPATHSATTTRTIPMRARMLLTPPDGLRRSPRRLDDSGFVPLRSPGAARIGDRRHERVRGLPAVQAGAAPHDPVGALAAAARLR